MHVAKLIEPHLVKEYIDKGITVNWNDWLGLPPYRTELPRLPTELERSEKPDWILNRFLPNIAAHASRLYLLNLAYSLWKRNGNPGFLNAPAMCRSIIQHGFEKRRKHIESMLLGDTHSFRVETIRNRSPYTLVVTKTGGEHQLKATRWPFRNQAMRGCLGDEKYRELILLEGYA
ncbi:Hypothetical protein NCS54_00290200 [Fusarium falciforme]|uniref:Hypothetical protein n=1 Tax=Fusarium falciforme TaxID=195108 RepID=UPI002301F5BB|nr:Hypothetical protein NCS54_00290200 [Fusarium falciforme]WAO85654.1 Hypothetical protein NCS54_00290200 [Fusarium falciforme]